MKIIRTTEPAVTAVKLLNEQLQSNFERPTLLLLSGGSWLSLYDEVDIESLGKWLTIGVLDERFSEDPAINNFTQLKQTQLYKKAKENGVSFIDTAVKNNETLVQLTERFNEVLQVWREQNPTGVVMVTMGLGPDGHTAGIFSTYENLAGQKEDCAVGYEVAAEINEFTKRITVTPYFLINKVQSAISFVSGDKKCQRLQQIISNEQTGEKIPAQIWNEIKSVTVVTDCLE